MATEKSAAKSQQKKNIVNFISADDIAVQAPEKRASKESFSTCVRVYQQNIRQGTVSCKGRSDVAYTNKKPWKQKGTGRARAGSARSPLWRGGGVTFGPQARVKTLKVPKKIRQKVMHTLLSDLLNKQAVVCADWQLKGDVPKTAQAYKMLKEGQLKDKRIALFLSSDDTLTRASFMNIDHVNVFFFDQPNVYDMARSNCWLFLKKDLDRFKEMVSQWT